MQDGPNGFIATGTETAAEREARERHDLLPAYLAGNRHERRKAEAEARKLKRQIDTLRGVERAMEAKEATTR